MATKEIAPEKTSQEVLLIAQLRAHLVSGGSFDLLPIKHTQDVKTEVTSLIESWAKSGFLIRGRHIYPWHQVDHIEVTQMEEIPRHLAEQRFDELYDADRTRVQEDFWRTKKKTVKESKENEGSTGSAPALH